MTTSKSDTSRSPQYFTVQLDAKDRRLLVEIAERDDVSLADAFRRSLRAYWLASRRRSDAPAHPD